MISKSKLKHCNKIYNDCFKCNQDFKLIGCNLENSIVYFDNEDFFANRYVYTKQWLEQRLIALMEDVNEY